jgi:Leucine-rich repeat (LRR) protein
MHKAVSTGRFMNDSEHIVHSRIAEFKKLGAPGLDLSALQLTSIPEEVFKLKGLRYLDLSENYLEVVNEEISALTELVELDFRDNNLKSLPLAITTLADLEELSLVGNSISELPEDFDKLASLRRLYLFRNQFCDLPESVCRLPSLTNLTINNNNLSSLGPCLGFMRAIEYLGLDNNHLTSIPEEIGRLDTLESLILSSNQLSEVPSSIGKLYSLKHLNLSNNRLREIPGSIGDLRNLESINIAGNELTKIPPELGSLEHLDTVDLEANRLPSIYESALSQGVESFRILLASLAGDVDALYEAKLLVTGEGQVGKSWALAKIAGADPESFVGPNNTTWGIDRGELDLPHPSEPGETIKLNTWDFGGQQVYRVTHQFFFSEMAVYLLMWNPRQGPDQCRVRDWLRTIALRTGSRDSDAGGGASTPRAKVIIVATHAQAEGGTYNPDYGSEALDDDLKSLIVDEASIDSRTGYGIEDLRDKIAKHAAALPDLGQPFNKRWANAREAVLQKRSEKPWVDFNEFRSLCAAHGVTGDDQLRTLAWTYLHSLGRAVWYGNIGSSLGEYDDAILADTIILDAVWLSRAFVQVLDDEETREHGGMLDHRRLGYIWTHHQRKGWVTYKPAEYEILLRVMRRFDVALPTRESHGKRSLVPQLVPHTMPVLPWFHAREARGERTVRLSCQLDHEAVGLVPRIVAATEPWHVYEDGQGLFWETGLFLADTASFNNEAVLTVHGSERPRVDVVVSGDQPAFLMNEIYKTLENVLSFWRGLNRSYYVGCPGRTKNSDYCSGRFKHDAVLRRVKSKADQKFDCQECDLQWQPDRLLLGLEAVALNQRYMISHLYNRDQLLCPRTFILRPAAKRVLKVTSWAGLVGKRFEIALLSELSGQEVAKAEFSFTEEWVKWVRPLTRVASVMLTGAAVPVTGDLAAEIKEGAAFLDKIGSMPLGEGDLPEASYSEGGRNLNLSKQQLSNFSAFLRGIGLDPREKGMDIAQASDGRWLWMSADEVAIYTPQEAAG